VSGGWTLLVAGLAGATPADDVHDCLDLYDLECARAAGAALGKDDASLAARGELAFALGDFPAARDALKAAGGSLATSEGYADRLALFQRSADATADFVAETRGDVTLRYRPGFDAVLTDEAFETLQAAHDRIGPILGGAPPGGVRMELYPTAQRFIDASSLPGTAVRTTGVIALSKWTRLLVSSPRALGRGYGWKDTIAHEYIHYIVAWRTLDRAPVWLQEGIARSHEALWRVAEPEPLAPTAASLLADALANDTLLPLAKMHPSMAFLSSPEEASLAYAQVSTMIVYLRKTKGPGAVSDVLDLVRGGRDALQAVADVGAGGDTTAFLDGWRAYLGSLKLVSRKLAEAAVVLDGAGDDFAADPVLGDRADLARFARLGDVLLDAGRTDAALVEYRKAAPAGEPPSPLLAARTATALVALDRRAEARALLEESVEDYPEFASTRALLGDLLLAAGDRAGAFTQLRASVDVDPFDPATQIRLADLYAARGSEALAERHRRYARLLQSKEPATR
jgi:tetratricopeptide (TPR) repeat protein